MAVDRPDVVESEFLEQGPGKHHPFHVLFPALGELRDRRQLGEDFLAAAANVVVHASRKEAREIVVERADRLRNRHVVVVENDQQVGAEGARVVQGFERHSCAHRAIADHRNHFALLAFAPRGDRHTERCRDRGRRMRGAEGVVLAFIAARKAGDAAPLPQLRHPFAAAGKNLVCVGLVADVPNDAIVRRVVDVMQRDGQLDGAEVGRKMAAGVADRLDDEIAQLACKLRQLAFVQPSQISGRMNGFEQHQFFRNAIQSASSLSLRAPAPKARSAVCASSRSSATRILAASRPSSET